MITAGVTARFRNHTGFVGTVRRSQRTDTNFFSHELVLADGRAIACQETEIFLSPEVGDEITDPTYGGTAYVIAVEERGIRISNAPAGQGGGCRFVSWEKVAG